MPNSFKRLRQRATYANVVATLALFLALGGVSWAAATAPKNSVATKSIKNKAVTSAKIKNNAVSGIKVKSGSLSGSDIKNDSLTGAQINELTLGSVPLAAKTETSIDNVVVAAASVDGADQAAARAAATEIPLATHSQVSLYAKCFTYTGTVRGEIYSRSTQVGGSQVAYSVYETLVGNSDTLDPATPEVDRRVASTSQGGNGIDYDYATGVSVLGADAKGFGLDANLVVRSGNPSNAPGYLSAPNTCMFHIAGGKVG